MVPVPYFLVRWRSLSKSEILVSLWFLLPPADEAFYSYPVGTPQRGGRGRVSHGRDLYPAELRVLPRFRRLPEHRHRFSESSEPDGTPGRLPGRHFPSGLRSCFLC